MIIVGATVTGSISDMETARSLASLQKSRGNKSILPLSVLQWLTCFIGAISPHLSSYREPIMGSAIFLEVLDCAIYTSSMFTS